MKNIFLAFLVFMFIFFLSGCLDRVAEFGCSFAPENAKDHCFQYAAVQTTNPDLCEKIEGKDFYMQNPPKDKCYLMIANKTNDPSLCSKMIGGPISYYPSVCYYQVAINTNDLSLCEKAEEHKDRCIKEIKLKTQNTQDEFEKIKQTTQEEQLQQPQKQEPKEQNLEVRQPPKEQKDVSEQTKQEIEIKQQTKLVDKEKQIQQMNLKPIAIEKLSPKTEQILNKIPQQAKEEIKSSSIKLEQLTQTSRPIPQPPEDNQQQQGFLSKAWDWVSFGAKKVNEINDAAGKESPNIIKTTATIAEVNEKIQDCIEVRDKFNEVSQKIESNQITQQQGRLLKVGYALGKAIKWTASWIPGFGDSVGSAADESFKTAMDFGQKLATHTTKTNKCIEDPLSEDCD